MNVHERLKIDNLSERDYEPRLQFELFEPRWHGFARWQLERHWKTEPDAMCAIVEVIGRGWIRRKRGESYLRIGGFNPLNPTGAKG